MKELNYDRDKPIIIPFESRYAKEFANLNLDWLNQYFQVEPHDADLLYRCKETIIDQGGYIFFAKINTTIAGTFSLIKIEDHTCELGKMAVSRRFRGKK